MYLFQGSVIVGDKNTVLLARMREDIVRNNKLKRFYVHEVYGIDDINKMGIQTGADPAEAGVGNPFGNPHIFKILNNVFPVKEKNNSIQQNVYHIFACKFPETVTVYRAWRLA